MQLRQDVAAFVGAELAWLTLCPAIPRVFDHLDQGIMARAVIVAANVLDRSGPQRDPRVPYLLHMRPICCGMTWGLARHGRLWIHPHCDRCDAFSHAGYRTQLSGEQVIQTDDGHIAVDAGTLIHVDFVPTALRAAQLTVPPALRPGRSSPQRVPRALLRRTRGALTCKTSMTPLSCSGTWPLVYRLNQSWHPFLGRHCDVPIRSALWVGVW